MYPRREKATRSLDRSPIGEYVSNMKIHWSPKATSPRHKPTTPSTAKPDPWSPEELEKCSTGPLVPPYRRFNLTRAQRDELALHLRVTRIAAATHRQTGKSPDQVEYKGQIYQFLY